MTHNFECGDWLLSRVHLEDAFGTWVVGTGQAYDCTRKGLDLAAAASESTQLRANDSHITLISQGALAIYRSASA